MTTTAAPPANNDETLTFYERFYAAIAGSRAYAEFCTRVFGRDFGQHGFADMVQLDALLTLLAIRPGERVLDLGCGNGAMDVYIAESTGAHVTGIDISPTAIVRAQDYARTPHDSLAFQVADIAALPFPSASFDVLIAIDTLYFTELGETVAGMKRLLKPGGRMGIYWSQGANPAIPIEVFPRETLPADNTDLAQALRRAGLSYQAVDFTSADYRHAWRKRAALMELRSQFEAENTLFLYDNRLGEADGVIAAVEAKAHARYLYIAGLSDAHPADQAEKNASSAS